MIRDWAGYAVIVLFFVIPLSVVMSLGFVSVSEALESQEPVILVVNNTVHTINHTHTHTETVQAFEFAVFTPSNECRGVTMDELTVWTAQGSSMEPYLFSWYRPLVKHYAGGLLVEGDIIAYRSGSGYTVHSVNSVYDGRRVVVCPLQDLFSGEGMTMCDVIDISRIDYVMCGVLYG